MTTQAIDVCSIGHNWIPKWGNRAMSAYECEDCGEMQYVGKIHSGPVTIGSKPVLDCRHARTFAGLRGEFCRGCSQYVSEEEQIEAS